MNTILTFRTTGRGTWRETFGGMADFAKTVAWRMQPVDARSRRPDVKSLVDFWNPAGAIIDGSGGGVFFSPADFKALPVVAINPEGPLSCSSIASVSNDPKEIAKLAMAELLRQAPESLLFVGWFHERSWVAARRQAAKKIASLHGLRIETISPESADEQNITRFIERLAVKLAAMPKPCGVFAVSDDIGAIVTGAAGKAGMQLPGDIAVVSVDDDPEVCENCTPTLTSIRPDYRRLGFDAAAALHGIIVCGDAAHRSFVPLAGTIRRASTSSAVRTDRKVASALETIRLHSCDGLRTSSVAAAFGTSLNTAEARFKAAAGRTIGAEIMQRRLAAACAYLRQGRSSIDAIANFCGWKSAAAFRKTFKKHYGFSPKRFADSRI